MKARKLILAILIFPSIIFGQDYCPFDFENGLWEADFYQAGGPDAIYQSQYNDYAAGDTLVNDSLLCYKLRRTWWDCGPADEFTCFDEENYTPFNYELGIICEQNKRIYYKVNLLYDFNVEVGDTIYGWWGIESWYTNVAPIIVSIEG